jgi:hypothetical protein
MLASNIDFPIKSTDSALPVLPECHATPQCSQQLTIAARIIEVAGDADMDRKLQQPVSTLHL